MLREQLTPERGTTEPGRNHLAIEDPACASTSSNFSGPIGSIQFRGQTTTGVIPTFDLSGLQIEDADIGIS